MSAVHPTGEDRPDTAGRTALRSEVADRAEARLRGNPYLALRNVTCEYQDGVLTLRGCLPSYHLKQVAQAAVAEVEGVARVENRIEVLAPQGRNSMTGPTPTPSPPGPLPQPDPAVPPEESPVAQATPDEPVPQGKGEPAVGGGMARDTPGTEVAGPPGAEQVVKRRGRFTLIRVVEGFAWTMTSEAGVRWYWHPGEQQWTGHSHASPTPEQATAGLDPEAPQAECRFHHHEPARPAQPDPAGGTP